MCILEAEAFFLDLGSAPAIPAGTIWTQTTFVLHIYCMSEWPLVSQEDTAVPAILIASAISFFPVLDSRKLRYMNVICKPRDLGLSWL